jgi:hypothetical protein
LLYSEYVQHPKYFIVIATCLLFIGAGCFRKPEPLTVLPEKPDSTSKDLTGDFVVTPTELNRLFILNDSASCTLAITYPELDPDQWPTEVLNEYTQAISGFISQTLGVTTPATTFAELPALADDYIQNCETEIQTEYQNLTTADDELYTNLQRTTEIVYAVELNSAPRLSVGLNQYSYTGGAHPNQRQVYFNLDREADKLLTLGDVIAADKFLEFERYEKTQLLANNRDMLYPENAASYEEIIADTQASITPELITSYGQRTNFYLTPTSLITYYNAYEIAPYAAGLISVEMPLVDIQTYLK